MNTEDSNRVWRSVESHPNYRVSSDGLVFNMKTARLLNPSIKKGSGYYYVHFVCERTGEQKLPYVHQLVANAFLGEKPDGHIIHHIDGNRLNNRSDNLEYESHSENQKSSWRSGTRKRRGS